MVDIVGPGIQIIKTAGTAADGAEFVTQPGPVTFTYVITNTGEVTLLNVVVVDDNGTPADTSDDVTVGTIASLDVGESVTLTKTLDVTTNRTNVATATGHTEQQPTKDVTDSDDAVVRVPTLTIAKDVSGELVKTSPEAKVEQVVKGLRKANPLALLSWVGPARKLRWAALFIVAALAIGLGLLSMGTGTVAVLAATAGAGVSIGIAASHIEKYLTESAAYGSAFDRVANCEVMLADIRDREAFNGVYQKYWAPGQFPARHAFGVTGLYLGARVEVACIAALK